MHEPSDITVLLESAAAGDAEARDALTQRTYEEVKAIARQSLAGSRGTLQPTVLAHEAFARMFHGVSVSPGNRRQFFGLVAKVMRDLVVDHARAAMAQKRGGGAAPQQITLDGLVGAGGSGSDVDVIDLTEALAELQQRDQQQHEIVELRFYAGLSMAEIAELQEVSLSTIEREWRAARAWLTVRLRSY